VLAGTPRCLASFVWRGVGYRVSIVVQEHSPHPVARLTSGVVVILPRLARALNAPAVAAVLGLVLIAVAIIGLATDDIRIGYAIVILSV
jgi:hypothetical protein